MHSSTCTLPPLSDLFLNNNNNNATSTASRSSSSVLNIANLLTSPTPNHHYYNNSAAAVHERNLKAKRKRASPNQLVVLNHIFAQTYFPSTEIRIELGKQLGMSPRTVQIWFQNKRQALRSRGRHTPDSPTSFYLPPISPPRSPPTDLRFHHFQDQSNFSLPPLRLVSPPQHCSPPTLSYPSPNSIDHLPYRDY
ncbi:hypothetical protein BDF21DRAFT_417337 [Thamnidium elegans]|uniref:Homeobox domain-containing protein n=1 Tax=Thamnidium elegans TaxID=101142 RepID=A0A8H7SME1_9FUNG|nr:hypothetical protein INT48_005154 [Thamnidium elegans]KAI8082195.1 hypothetical protein BDF21DRAFT_417337 [Thamnidium elegans]